MQWALKNNEKITATPKDKASCPLCNEEVIAKCGSIKIWHWSHISNKDCDTWYEPETEWHKSWKDNFPKEQQEFVMGKHRADIRTKDRWIIELQNGNLSPAEIQERENYYKRMIWLLNGKKLGKGLEFTKDSPSYISFKWKYFPKSWINATKNIYVDLGNKILGVKKIYENERDYESMGVNSKQQHTIIIKTKRYPISGWGYLIAKEEFLKRFLEDDENTNTK
jgi:competence CoiA-like predicted nuclease